MATKKKAGQPRLFKCRLCRMKPTVIDDFSDEGRCIGHYEIDCGCGVYVYAEKLVDATKLWNRLMRKSA